VIPVELELHNFLAYREPGTLRLEGIHIACLAGPNGAGKSSLLDAITWALWGEARARQADELIHQGESEMRVALTFDQGGSLYRVVRQRKAGKRGSTLLELQGRDPATGDWNSLSEASLKGTERKIESLIRLDYPTFVNSAFLIQGRADEFTKKAPAERKQILAAILGLSRWDVFEERAKDRVMQTRDQIQRLEGRLEEIDRELSQRAVYEEELRAAGSAAEQLAETLAAAERQWADLQETRSEVIALQRQIDDLTRRITGEVRELREAEGELEAARRRADRQAIEAAREEITAALGALNPIQIRFDAASEGAVSLAKEAAALRGANQALGPETEPIKVRATALENASEPACPTCGQPLTDEHRSQLLQELRAEIDRRREAYRANQVRVREIEAQAAQLEREVAGLSAQLRERPALEKRAGELEASLGHAEEASRQAASLQAKIARWREELAADEASREKLESQAEASERRLRTAALRQEDLDRMRLEKRLADERVGGARQKLAALENFGRQRAERLADRDRLAGELGLYQDLRVAFGKRGVPAMIIETVVPELEAAANDLLGRMSDSRLHVRIETQKETRGGEVRESLDIVISDELGSRSYELYSGGEAFRINFAIRIALSRLLARRAGAQLRSLFIDEGFGTQDASGREHLVAAINSIQGDFDRILVITHIDELKDSFPARIEVTKTPDGSRFTLA
jgi:exonuclease SbcC